MALTHGRLSAYSYTSCILNGLRPKFLVGLGEIDMSVKMRTTCTWTERPYEASLFPGIGFGPFLCSLGGRRRRPPFGGLSHQ
ncbi:hypothetical protein R6Q59_016211 [Mikania micrantha]